MSLTAGARVGPYEILAPLGAGGMGEVYRARDTKLNRDVAIKVLLPAVANDPDRLARFSREAQVLASLNHSNIAAIYGIEETSGVTALVMELVEGEDLSQRISRGPIPIDEALPIARQIAEALEVAHECGIIHRDLKPANIKMRADGTVKVLDFGLAKAIDPGGHSSSNAMNSPTLSIHATEAGIILGTAAYMSPEQAAGKSVDKRSDLWAFGVVLLEMLTGRQTFAGETVSHVLAAVLKDDPDWSALPAETPAPIRRLLRRCLEKDRKRRLPDAATARLEIDDALTHIPEASSIVVPGRHSKWRERIAWALASTFAIVAVLFAIRGVRAVPIEMMTTRFSIAPPDGSALLSNGGGGGSAVAVSPDGRRVVLVVVGSDSTPRLWVRALDATSPQPLPGTEGATSPFWSPDSRWVAFFAAGKLKRIAIAGGGPQVLCDSAAGGGGTWNRDDVIVFSPAPAGEGGLVRVAGGGGTPAVVTTLDAAHGETNHLWPQFLPDGRHYLYVVGGRDNSGLYVGSLDSDERTLLLDLARLGDEYSKVEYADPGYLLFVRDRALLAQGFNASRLAIEGGVAQVADGVVKEGPGSSSFSVSTNGVLVFWGGVVPPETQLTWMKRDGTSSGTVGQAGAYFGLSLSRDERTVAVNRFEPNEKVLQVAVWLIDVQRSTSTKLTFGIGSHTPTWSPDGARIAFSSPRGGPPSLFQKPADNVGQEELLFKSPAASRPNDWSADGQTLIYQSTNPRTNWDLWLLPRAVPTPTPLLRTQSNETDARISPDGRWMAYVSDESGTPEVYVTGFPTVRGKWSISTGGGESPEWSRDGKELFYVASKRKLTVVPVNLALDGTKFDAGARRALFDLPALPIGVIGWGNEQQYAPTADGQRFLIPIPTGPAVTSFAPATVVVNWTAGIPK
jgi:Tol biopolymer transport system component